MLSVVYRVYKREVNGMFLQFIADFIKRFACMGAGLASWGPGYQPKLPEELEK